MAQKLPTMVTSAKGKEYSSDSTQGQVIVQAKADAAAKAATSQPFSADSSALASITPVLESISSNVMSISETLTTIVAISQADSRGDALNKSNVPQDDLKPETSEQLSSGQMRDRGEDSDGGGLGGLMGIGAAVGGFGKGLSFWGTPLAMAGAATFVLFLGGLALVAYLGAKAFGDGANDIARGMETLSNADVDTDKVIALGEALSAFGLAMAAEGLGKGIGGLGTLVGGIAEGFAGFLGIEKKDPMIALKEFAKTPITEAELKQIEINARALTVFSGAMAVEGVATLAKDVTNLVGGVVNFAASFLPAKEDPMLEMIKFAGHQITETQVDQIILNSKALVGFSTVMAGIEGIGVLEKIAGLVGGVISFATSFLPAKEDPMLKMIEFAKHKITQKEVDQIKLNAGALIAFSGTMALSEGLGAVEKVGTLVGGIAKGISSFFGIEGADPLKSMADVRKFAETKITQTEADQIELNAKALAKFSGAMALYSAGGAVSGGLDLLGGMAKGITKFFGGTVGIDYKEIKKFAESGIGEYEEAITKNAAVLKAFSLAMAGNAGDDMKQEFTNIGANILGAIGSIFGGKKEDKIPYEEIKTFANSGIGELETKIVANAKTLGAFSTAMKDNASAEADAGWVNIKANFLGAISSIFGGKQEDSIPYEQMKLFANSGIGPLETKIVANAKALTAFSVAMGQNASAQAEGGWANIKANFLGAVGSIFGAKSEDNIPYEKITAFAATPWTEDTTKRIIANAATLHAYTSAIATMASLKQTKGFWAGIGDTLSGAFSALMGQDTLPIKEIEKFTEKELNLARVENNISAIEKFILFGQSMVGFKGGDLSGVSDFAEAIVGSAHGIKYALHGGEGKYGVSGMFNDIKIKPGQGLASVALMDMTEASLGVAVLRHALTNSAPLQQLQAASAAMDTSTGGVNIVDASTTNATTNSSASVQTMELGTDHIEESQSFLGRISSWF